MYEIIIGLSVVILAFVIVSFITRSSRLVAFKKVGKTIGTSIDWAVRNFGENRKTNNRENGNYEVVYDMPAYTITFFFNPLNRCTKIVHESKEI